METNFCLNQDIEDIVSALGDLALEFSGKTIILTGGRGFLGRYFTSVFSYLNKSILDKPCKVYVIDNFITAGHLGQCTSFMDEHIHFHKQSVLDPFTVDRKVDYILHCAGIASPYYYRAHPLETLDVAITGTRNFLELAKQHGARILFFSSSEIYGDPDPKYVPTEEGYRGNVSCLGPRACYDESKRLGETLCQIYHRKFGVHTNMVRPFNVYGPGMQELDYRVLPNFAKSIVNNLPLNVYGVGTQTRTFCYVTDAINGFLRVLTKGVAGEPYNIGNPTPEISMLDLVKTIEKVLQQELPVNRIGYPDSYPADEPNRRCPNISKAMYQLEFKPHISLEVGLRRFLDWALNNYTQPNTPAVEPPLEPKGYQPRDMN